ncbi:hypothetical protein BC830DRAFT_826635 [Chytriomyces sp. MP71]|nr:hypothetical protein BC830DRAFT_826635 [Chytriomyces sp. MP71]
MRVFTAHTGKGARLSIKASLQPCKQQTYSLSTIPVSEYTRISRDSLYAPSIAKATNTAKQHAIVFGWMNADPKHVSKYANVYRNRGFDVHVVLSDSSQLWDTSSKVQIPHEALLRHLNALKLLSDPSSTKETRIEAPKAVIHALSNGGCIQLRNLVHHLHSNGKSLNARAVILDSCPGYATPETGAAFYSLNIKNDFFRRIVRSTLLLSLRWFGPLFVDVKNHPIELSARSAISQQNKQGNVRGSRLFLYSDADELVSLAEVTGRIRECRDEGVQVEEKVFHGSPHVKHAVLYPEQYWRTVFDFIARNK